MSKGRYDARLTSALDRLTLSSRVPVLSWGASIVSGAVRVGEESCLLDQVRQLDPADERPSRLVLDLHGSGQRLGTGIKLDAQPDGADVPHADTFDVRERDRAGD